MMTFQQRQLRRIIWNPCRVLLIKYEAVYLCLDDLDMWRGLGMFSQFSSRKWPFLLKMHCIFNTQINKRERFSLKNFHRRVEDDS